MIPCEAVFRLRALIGRIIAYRQHVWAGPVVFSAIYFLLQFTQISAYGVTWDEPLHRNWGKIFALFWQTGDRHLLELMPGHGIDYGPLYFYLNYLFSEILSLSGALSFVEANHLLTLVVSAFAVGLTYVLGNMIGGKGIGFLSALAVVLFPQFVAHAHYNPKDIPLMAAVLVVVITFLTALRRNSRALLITAAFFFGLSVAVKINALLMAPVFGLTYLLWLFEPGRQSSALTLLRKELPVILAAGVASMASLYLFWPSAWGDLMLIPRAIRFFLGADFWPGTVLFFGKHYAGAELPWYYIPFEFIVATPLLMLLACIAGIFVEMRAVSSPKTRTESAILLLWILFPLVFSMKPGLVRYDGMRQFFFVLPAVAIVSAIGFRQLILLLKRKSKSPFSGVIFPGLVLLSLTSQVLTLHPFEGSYRNELVQLAYKDHLEEVFQIEYWGAPYKQGMDWLRDNAELNAVICVPTAGILVTWYPWREDFTFECSKKSNYIMFLSSYSEAKAYQGRTEPVFEVQRMHSTLLLLYKISVAP